SGIDTVERQLSGIDMVERRGHFADPRFDQPSIDRQTNDGSSNRWGVIVNAKMPRRAILTRQDKVLIHVYFPNRLRGTQAFNAEHLANVPPFRDQEDRLWLSRYHSRGDQTLLPDRGASPRRSAG